MVASLVSFNEAAGFTRRKRHHANQKRTAAATIAGASMRPPDLPGGNPQRVPHGARLLLQASMRPPDLPGGTASIIAFPSAPR